MLLLLTLNNYMLAEINSLVFCLILNVEVRVHSINVSFNEIDFSFLISALFCDTSKNNVKLYFVDSEL